jgi:YD repeat-containing protein
MVDHTIDGRGHTDAQYVYAAPCGAAYNTATINYTGLYPSSSSNALGQTSQYTWDCDLGKVSTVTDRNNQTTGFQYDAMGSAIHASYPDGGSTTADYHGYVLPLTVTVSKAETATSSISASSIYDGLGRVITTINANGATSEATYDGLGNVLTVSNPHVASPSLTDGTTSYTYDALNRPLLQCNPDNGSGSTCSPGSSYLQWSYLGNVTTAFDELRHQTQRTNDALGRLTKVIEHGSLTTNYNLLTTNYDYDALGNSLAVHQLGNGIDDLPRNRSFSYDSLSRLICASNPESSSASCLASVSPTYTAGTVGYTYDQNGNLASKTDPRGVLTNYHYDNLNRLIGRDYGSGTAPGGSLSSCYAYDSAVNGIGRIGSEWSTPDVCPSTTGYKTLRTFISYDAMGRLLNERECVLGVCTSGPTPPCAVAGSNVQYYQAYCYDLAGNVIWSANGVTNVPGVTSVGFTGGFDQGGRLTSLNSSWSDATHLSGLFSASSSTAFIPSGSLQNFNIGNSVLNRTYDNRVRVTGEVATRP